MIMSNKKLNDPVWKDLFQIDKKTTLKSINTRNSENVRETNDRNKWRLHFEARKYTLKN